MTSRTSSSFGGRQGLTALLARVRHRRVYRELLNLDDHLLADIGVNRADIAARLFGRRPGLSAEVVMMRARATPFAWPDDLDRAA